MDKDLILTYDFGTSSVKAALFDNQGAVISIETAFYPLIKSKPGWIEQNPDDWLQAMAEVTRKIISQAGIETSRIAALNICSQMCGTLPVDKQGKPLGNCIIWLDSRSRDIANQYFGSQINIGGYSIGSLYRWLWKTNGVPNLSGRDPITKILWLRDKMPEVWKQIYKFLDVKDYINFFCCNQYTTTYDCAHITWLMDSRINRKNWSTCLLAYLDLNKEILPEIKDSTDITGELVSEAADFLGLQKGTAILAGSGDVTSSALGAGTIVPGDIHLHIGSSAWFGSHIANRKVDLFSGIGTLCSIDPELYLLIAAQKSAGQCIDWFTRTFDLLNEGSPDYAAFESAASKVSPASNNLFFFPWLSGEHVPKNDLNVRGGFINLSSDHKIEDMSYSILEGIGLNICWMYHKFNNLYNHSLDAINFVGGAANNNLWCQILADIIQCPIKQMDLPHLGGTRGVAMTAGISLGWYKSFQDAASTARVKQVYYPDHSLAALYNERYQMFLEFYKRNIPWYKKLNIT